MIHHLDETVLKTYYQNEVLQEVLFLKDANLYTQYKQWLKGRILDTSILNQLQINLTIFLSKCLTVSGFEEAFIYNLGQVQTKTSNYFNQNEPIKRNTKLSLAYLQKLIHSLTKEEALRVLVKLYPHPSLYILADKLHYAIYQYASKNYQVITAHCPDYLKKIIQAAKDGKTVYQLTDLLIADAITREEATAFIQTLIDNQILVSEFYSLLHQPHAFDKLLLTLENLNLTPLQPLIKSLKQVLATIQTINTGKLSLKPSVYRNIAQKLSVQDWPMNRLLKTTITKNTEKTIEKCHLDALIAERIRGGIQVLQKLQTPVTNTAWKQFKIAFFNRYGYAEIPLIQVLDDEMGIGYPPDLPNVTLPLIENLTFSNQNSTPKLNDTIVQFFLKKYRTAIENKAYEIELTATEIQELPDGKCSFMEVGLATCQLLQSGDETFAYLEGVRAERYTKFSKFGVSKKPQHSDILATVMSAHTRSDTSLRLYEIPYIHQSSFTNSEYSIPLEDLTVAIRQDKIVLRSKRLKQAIQPYLVGDATIFTTPLLQFLDALQTQDRQTQLAFNWANWQLIGVFRPRLKYKTVILALASWHFKAKDLQSLQNQTQFVVEDNSLKKLIKKWRSIYQIPNVVTIITLNQKCLIDFTNPFLIRVFLNITKNVATIQLVEHPFNNGHALVQDTKGALEHQLVIPFKFIKSPLSSKIASSFRSITTTLQRNFSLGSEWLYYKWYGNVPVIEAIITTILPDLVHILQQNQWIDQWFFIRYADPKPHLRLRFHMKDVTNLQAIIALIYNTVQPWQIQNKIWKIQTDTYQREIERYGENTMLLSEQLFHYDSQMMIRLLPTLQNEEQRWKYGLLAIDAFFNDFQLPLVEKQTLMQSAMHSFNQEFESAMPNVEMQMEEQYKIRRTSISKLFKQTHIPSILEKSENIASIIQQIQGLKSINQFSVKYENWMLSHIHMLLNRLLLHRSRLQEMVIYNLLYRWYLEVNFE